MDENKFDLKVTNTYDESQIQILEGLEAVRKRPGMYIGSTSVSGLHHLVYEIVDNAIDEALAGYCTHIEVTIEEGNSIQVVDDGRGIPTEKHHQTGTSTLEVVYTMLHAGGKFGNGGYKVSGGLHGVGASVVNALSRWLEVRVYNGESIKYMRFEHGKKTGDIATIGATDRTGTTVRFLPDDEIFDTIEFDYNTLLTRLREQAFLNAGLSITLEDKRKGREAKNVLCYEGGIRQFVERMNRAKNVLHKEVIYIRGDRNDSAAEIALQYNDGFDSNIYSFANDIRTTEGGMHETGFKTALTKVINEYARKFKIIKEDDPNFSGEDTREGLSAVISVKLMEAQFEGQTKTKLGNSEMRTLVDNVVSLKKIRPSPALLLIKR